jgi:hypothetical protein
VPLGRPGTLTVSVGLFGEDEGAAVDVRLATLELAWDDEAERDPELTSARVD